MPLKPCEYKKYITSKQWRDKRAKILEFQKTCEECGAKERLHIHHLTKKGETNERLSKDRSKDRSRDFW
jgi:hypothetical protein